jgi:hypothetical protein
MRCFICSCSTPDRLRVCRLSGERAFHSAKVINFSSATASHMAAPQSNHGLDGSELTCWPASQSALDKFKAGATASLGASQTGQRSAVSLISVAAATIPGLFGNDVRVVGFVAGVGAQPIPPGGQLLGWIERMAAAGLAAHVDGGCISGHRGAHALSAIRASKIEFLDNGRDGMPKGVLQMVR